MSDTHSNHDVPTSSSPGICKPSGLCLYVNVPPPRSIQRRGLGNSGKDGNPAVSIVFSFVFPEKYLQIFQLFTGSPPRWFTSLFRNEKVLRAELSCPSIPISDFQVTCSAPICPQHFQSAWRATRKGLRGAWGAPTLIVCLSSVPH